MTDNLSTQDISEVTENASAPVTLSLKETLFSFRGRIRRSTYWKIFLALIGIMIVVVFLGIAMNVNEIVATTFLVILYIPLIWISLALQVKRWHDRDKSGWFVLVSFIPIIGPIWAFIENGCLAGSDTANRFGPPES